ncbi:MAG: helical backbone metal receptor [bacterium]
MTVTISLFLIFIFYDKTDGKKEKPCRNIISTAPSITESLCAMDLCDRISGVTKHCDYPPAVEQLPSVGTYTNINPESVISLNPDTIITFNENQKLIEKASVMNIRTVTLNHNTTPGLLESFHEIGSVCEKEEEAGKLINKIQKKLKNITERCRRHKPVKVMIVLGRCLSCDRPEDIYVAGKSGFYEDLIYAAGGKNVFEKTELPFPRIATESLISANPDVIIEIIPHKIENDEKQRLISTWQTFKTLSAVKNGRIHILTERYLKRPGPEIHKAAELLCSVLHSDDRD